MSLDPETVRHVARLARIDLSEAERRTYGAQLDSILKYVEQLNALELDDVAPLSHAGDFEAPMREDTPRPGLRRPDALRNAPEKDDAFFIVPRIIDQP